MPTPQQLTALEFWFDPETHTYHLGRGIEDREIPGLSHILRHAGMQTDYSFVPEMVLQQAREMGTAVHAACELLDAGTLDEDALPECIAPDAPNRDRLVSKLLGHVESYKRFRDKYQPQVLAAETPILHMAEPLYGCTPDRHVVIGGECGVLEIKTTYKLAPFVRLQLTGQKFALKSAWADCDVRWVVQTLPDGRMPELVRYNEDERDEAAFRGVLATYKWKEANRCL